MSEGHNSVNEQRIREIYRYDEMSNKVLKVDKRLQENKTDLVKDAKLCQPKSMLGKISVKEMGSQVTRNMPEDEKLNAIKDVDKTESLIRMQIKRSHLDRTEQEQHRMPNYDDEKLNYNPTDEKNSKIYESVVTWVANLLGDDTSHSAILSATDLILKIIKSKEQEDDGNISLKKEEIEKFLDINMSNSSFNTLINITNQITDYYEDKKNFEMKGISIFTDENKEYEEEENKLTEDMFQTENEYENEPASNFKSKTSHKVESTTDIIELNTKNLNNDIESIPIYHIDDTYLVNIISQAFPTFDQSKTQNILRRILKTLEISKYLEKELAEILGINNKTLVNSIIANKDKIFWGVKLSNSNELEIENVLIHMNSLNLNELVLEYKKRYSETKKRALSMSEDSSSTVDKKLKKTYGDEKPRIIDINNLKFNEGGKLMTITKVSLHQDSFKKVNPFYEEIHIPPPQKESDDFELLPISMLPKWAQAAFPTNETKTFNRIQSEVFHSAFKNDFNLLLCAPTGAGKTNVALLTILRTMSRYYHENSNKFDTANFKVIYIAPLKALVQEQVREFQRRLYHYGIKVSELTGDVNLTRQQIMETQILVSTPEKWDVITRKSTDLPYIKLVKLIIIDEIHLLHDGRGPVLENIVARTLRNKQQEESVRIVGLSATLPNYEDIAKFLRVPNEGLFYFDSSFRPCPLAQQFCGITEESKFKKISAMNQVCYDKIIEAAENSHQVIIFVHSRKDTSRTAKWLRDKLVEEDKINLFAKSDPSSKEILKRESENIVDNSLKDLLRYGFAIHHAGLTKNDRTLSEDLFADGLIQVLVSTATLAWGVNLPAHTVIIKGTEIYSPEKGDWIHLSFLDVLQMLGRAGRPKYDTHGEGIIITNKSEIQYYLAIMNQQLPIESQLASRIIDSLNAEIVLGNIKTRFDAIDWIGYTYLYIRMLKSPDLYNVVSDRDKENNSLSLFRGDLVHSALSVLAAGNLIVYDENSGSIQSTNLGRIASHFYVTHTSISMYNDFLNGRTNQIDILRVFSMSEEFKYIPIRPEEKSEISNILERVPIPIKETSDDGLAKINVLLQSYIARLNMEGFALNADMVYITQNAGRILRAMFEISLGKKLSQISKILLNLCKSVEKRMWLTNSPLRQFPRCPVDVIKRTEASSLPWIEYLNLSSPNEVSQAIRSEKYGKSTFDLIQRFPKLKMQCSVQPITPSLLKFDLEILPEWIWDIKLHGPVESFFAIVEDTDGENILFSDYLTIEKDFINKEHFMDFTIQLNSIQQSIRPSVFFISLISEKWLHCTYRIPIVLDTIQFPKKFPAPTQLLEMPLIHVKELEIQEFIEKYNFDIFNKFQTQVFHSLYHTNENILIGSSKGTGKTVMIELAILNHFRQNKGRIVYICPSNIKINTLTMRWKEKFSNIGGGKNINKLGSEIGTNLRILALSHLILATPEQFDLVSRRWKQRKNVQKIELLIADNIHQISDGIVGAIYEIVLSRMVFISAQLETGLRIIGISTSLTNGKDFGEWIGVNKDNIFNFSSQERITPLQIQLKSFHNIHNSLSIEEMVKTTLKHALPVKNVHKATIIFVSERKNCIDIGSTIIKFAKKKNIDLLRFEDVDFERNLNSIRDINLKTYIKNGVGYLYSGMEDSDRFIVEHLFERDFFSFILATREYCMSSFKSNFIVVLGTQYYESREHRFVDYTINEILEMVGTASVQSEGHIPKAIVYTTNQKKDYYKKFLSESLPTESFIYFHLHESFSNEISTGIIETKQDCIDWITYTYFYRRIHANPSFYGLKDTSALGISAYLTELVEETLNDLIKSSLIEIESVGDEKSNYESESEEGSQKIIPLNNCFIGSHHNISFSTMQMFVSSLNRGSTLASILEILASASEFNVISVRKNEMAILSQLNNSLPLKFSRVSFAELSAFKTFILLQVHFSRINLPIDMKIDLSKILQMVFPLINAIIDILSGEGYLNATSAMDISQMLVQGIWDTDSPLKQIPHFDDNILTKCAEKKVETVYDIMALEDEERDEILILPSKDLIKVAHFVNNYPNIELKYHLDLSNVMIVSQSKEITITLARDDEPETLQVVSDQLTIPKTEAWWLFIGETTTRQIYSIRRVILTKQVQEYIMDLTIHTPGIHNITIWCVCDSYIDADKEVSFEINVQEAIE